DAKRCLKRFQKNRKGVYRAKHYRSGEQDLMSLAFG
ncbi:MAG: hypothetical protein ACI9C3_002026, partial [Yoonia sp.]